MAHVSPSSASSLSQLDPNAGGVQKNLHLSDHNASPQAHTAPEEPQADAHARTRQLLRKRLTERQTVTSSTTPPAGSRPAASRRDECRGGEGSAHSNKKKRRRDKKERVSRGFSHLGGVQEHHPHGGDTPTATVGALMAIHRPRPPADPRHGLPKAPPLLPPQALPGLHQAPPPPAPRPRYRSTPFLSRSLSSSFPAFPPSTTPTYTGFSYAPSSSASSSALSPCWPIAATSPEGFFPYYYYAAPSPSHPPASFLDMLVTLTEERLLSELSQGCHTGPAELFPWIEHLQEVPHVTTAPPPASLPPRLLDRPCPTPKMPNQP
jgi:hypothetical protein